MKVNLIQGELSLQLRKSILQDWGNNKIADYLKKDAPKVVNK
ncbi:hypothetical protein [Paenibacillus ottowii]|nr:hypothetical protein [Paenibacillus ottowii]